MKPKILIKGLCTKYLRSQARGGQAIDINFITVQEGGSKKGQKLVYVLCTRPPSVQVCILFGLCVTFRMREYCASKVGKTYNPL